MMYIQERTGWIPNAPVSETRPVYTQHERQGPTTNNPLTIRTNSTHAQLFVPRLPRTDARDGLLRWRLEPEADRPVCVSRRRHLLLRRLRRRGLLLVRDVEEVIFVRVRHDFLRVWVDPGEWDGGLIGDNAQLAAVVCCCCLEGGFSR